MNQLFQAFLAVPLVRLAPYLQEDLSHPEVQNLPGRLMDPEVQLDLAIPVVQEILLHLVALDHPVVPRDRRVQSDQHLQLVQSVPNLPLVPPVHLVLYLRANQLFLDCLDLRGVRTVPQDQEDQAVQVGQDRQHCQTVQKVLEDQSIRAVQVGQVIQLILKVQVVPVDQEVLENQAVHLIPVGLQVQGLRLHRLLEVPGLQHFQASRAFQDFQEDQCPLENREVPRLLMGRAVLCLQRDQQFLVIRDLLLDLLGQYLHLGR